VLRELIKSKAARAVEAADLSLRLTKDLRSRAALLSCYGGILRDRNDASEVSFELRAGGQRFPVTMRRSDVFTLSEIFYDEEYAIYTRLQERPLVLDCGANVGLSGIWFLSRWPGARVHAFEPEPANFRFLSKNLGSRGDSVVNQAAVGREQGTVELHVAEHGAMHSVKDRSAGARTIDVPCVNLADYLRGKRIDRVDLLKLDVEGSELDVVEGLGSLIDDVGVIVGELHERMVDEAKFYRYVESKGFRRVKRSGAREEGVHLFELAR
jgi:FkbM family methyltransferase